MKTILPTPDYAIDLTSDFIKKVNDVSINHICILASLDIVSDNTAHRSYMNKIIKITEISLDPDFPQNIRIKLK